MLRESGRNHPLRHLPNPNADCAKDSLPQRGILQLPPSPWDNAFVLAVPARFIPES
jgi:hypothetical protein